MNKRLVLILYNLSISDEIDEKLAKLKKTDKNTLKAISKKIPQIQKNPYHFKPLRHDMQGVRRVHIMKSFVLTFEIIESEHVVCLLDFDHHDNIYRKFSR